MKIITFCTLFIVSLPAFADQEAGNRIYVTAADYGQFYAKSIPAENYGLKGRTEVYQVGEKDKLLQTYDWYSPQVYLYGWLAGGVYAVQTGSWNRGHAPQSDHLAVAFYKDDKLLKKYSTLDIAGDSKNVSASVSHYMVFQKINGFRRAFSNQLYFDVVTTDGRSLSFDVETGKIVSPAEEAIAKTLEEARSAIGNLKYTWYEKNKDKFESNKKIKLTKDMLNEISPGKFPTLPVGYEYIPGEVWGPAEIKKSK